MRMFILVGAPGSGKTTWAATQVGGVICSADHFFTAADGTYRFDPAGLGYAHSFCFRDAVEAVQDKCRVVVVDNTNTTLVEIAPYVALGRAYGYEVIPLVFSGTYKNVHGVSDQQVLAARARIADTLNAWPRFWPEPCIQSLPESATDAQGVTQ